MFRVITLFSTRVKLKSGGFFLYILRILRWLAKLKQIIVNVVKKWESWCSIYIYSFEHSLLLNIRSVWDIYYLNCFILWFYRNQKSCLKHPSSKKILNKIDKVKFVKFKLNLCPMNLNIFVLFNSLDGLWKQELNMSRLLKLCGA